MLTNVALVALHACERECGTFFLRCHRLSAVDARKRSRRCCDNDPDYRGCPDKQTTLGSSLVETPTVHRARVGQRQLSALVGPRAQTSQQPRPCPTELGLCQRAIRTPSLSPRLKTWRTKVRPRTPTKRTERSIRAEPDLPAKGREWPALTKHHLLEVGNAARCILFSRPPLEGDPQAKLLVVVALHRR